MTLDELRSTLPYRCLEWKWPEHGFKSPRKASFTPFRITGGIGDLILGLGVAEALNAETGDVVVYSKWPKVVEYFSDLGNHHDDDLMDYGYDFIVYCNSIVKFQFFNGFKGFDNPKLDEIFIKHRNFINQGQGEWTSIVDHHPHLDNRLGVIAVEQGFNRESLSYAFLKLSPSPRKTVRKFSPGPMFITIHDGFDENNTDVKGRSMKNWNMLDWQTLVHEIRSMGIECVQLGAKNSRKIVGANWTHLGIPITESFDILKNSSLHIDGDSGLVHAAHVLNVPSVVLFGPTNAKFFGYEENINITPNIPCSDCWWLQPNWMSKCPVGNDYPRCMDSITPREVLDAVKDILDFKYKRLEI